MPASSPWRQPVVWLMLVMIGLVVAAGITTWFLAAADGPMDVVPDDVTRTGQIQQADLDPDVRATRMQLTAIVRIDPAHDLVEVLPVSGDFDHAQPLHLRLLHPAQAQSDLQLTLTPHETGWRVQATPSLDHDWQIQLEPASPPRWRLHGRLPKGQQAAHLHPALASGPP
ncbi:FixH family protein [Thermomonas hydrothermalis]|uniref:Nitrogen fixation protein FixH n=1 Tax=Thermomonas hydrothermalis TaxID=213588 RepID=A0A1M4ZQP4_9GAMM|nr:FixH family protein [Thermomonas hydrothermalis]SHF19866.1 hypothetical protein SAMN02745204_02000 [Thermomonas hydrothermalis]